MLDLQTLTPSIPLVRGTNSSSHPAEGSWSSLPLWFDHSTCLTYELLLPLTLILSPEGRGNSISSKCWSLRAKP